MHEQNAYRIESRASVSAKFRARPSTGGIPYREIGVDYMLLVGSILAAASTTTLLLTAATLTLRKIRNKKSKMTNPHDLPTDFAPMKNDLILRAARGKYGSFPKRFQCRIDRRLIPISAFAWATR